MLKFSVYGHLMTMLRICAVALLFPSFAFAQDAISRDIAQCAVIAGELERLDCYDAVARNNNLAGEQPQDHNITATGEWNVGIRINPIDDSRTVVLSVASSSGASSFGDTIGLVLRCKSNTTNAYIVWDDYLGSETFVLTRIGKEKASEREWYLSSDSQASFHPQPIAFIKDMIGHDTLIAQTTPYGENPVTAIFNIAGLENAIKPLRETCNW